MAVDYLSTLNTKGSGINITQLVDSLVLAETEPKKNLIKGKLEKETVAISEMTKLRSELVALSTLLTLGETGNSLSASSSNESVSVKVNDFSKAIPVTAAINVTTLASAQVMEFGGFTGKDALLNPNATDAITLSFGTWSNTGFATQGTTASGAVSNTNGYTVKLGNTAAGDTITIVTGGITVSALVGSNDTATLSNLQTALGIAASPITTFSVASTATPGSFEFTDSAGSNMSTNASVTGSKASQAIALTATSTLAQFATALNALDGVSASIVDKGTGTYSLMIKSNTGVDNAIHLSSTSGNFTTTASASGLPTQQLQAAANASFTVDGATLSRKSNEVTDLFDGLTVTLNSTTASGKIANIVSSESASAAELEMADFVTYINEVRSTLNDLTKRGVNGAEPGHLAGDITVNSVKRKISSLTTEPIVGFSDNPIYLSDLGIKTERDGSLSFDKVVFQKEFAADPSKYKAVFQSKITSSISAFTSSASSSAKIEPGVYDIAYSSGADTLTVDCVTFVTSARTNFDTSYYRSTGNFGGLSLSASPGSAASGKLYVGTSLKEKLTGYIDALLKNSGDFTIREQAILDDKTSYDDEIAKLEEDALSIEARYIEKFTSMEQMVTRFKSTGSYLTTMMDQWSNQR